MKGEKKVLTGTAMSGVSQVMGLLASIKLAVLGDLLLSKKQLRTNWPRFLQ